MPSMISEMAVVGEHFAWWVFAYISRNTGTFNCLSVRIVLSGGIKICSWKIGKIISLILFAVVRDHRKSLTDPLPALVPVEKGNGQYF